LASKMAKHHLVVVDVGPAGYCDALPGPQSFLLEIRQELLLWCGPEAEELFLADQVRYLLRRGFVFGHPAGLE
jgi:hypothetical protein